MINWWTDSKATFRSSIQKSLVPKCNQEGNCGFFISKDVSNKLPPVDYVKYFVTWTALHTFRTLTSVDGAQSVLEYARGFVPGRAFLRDLLGFPVLAAAAHAALLPFQDNDDNPSCITSWKLVTDESDYRNTGVHYHDYFSAEDIGLFSVQSVTFKDGKKVSLPILMVADTWAKWLPDFTIDSSKRELCVNYCIRKFLVAKDQVH